MYRCCWQANNFKSISTKCKGMCVSRWGLSAFGMQTFRLLLGVAKTSSTRNPGWQNVLPFSLKIETRIWRNWSTERGSNLLTVPPNNRFHFRVYLYHFIVTQLLRRALFFRNNVSLKLAPKQQTWSKSDFVHT